MKRGDDYDQIKDAIGHHMWEQVCELYPQLRDKVTELLLLLEHKTQHFKSTI